MTWHGRASGIVEDLWKYISTKSSSKHKTELRALVIGESVSTPPNWYIACIISYTCGRKDLNQQQLQAIGRSREASDLESLRSDRTHTRESGLSQRSLPMPHFKHVRHTF
ncbi:hypothetical protein L596_004419 [Steinernema carpocapsae]|uniref:Uncharacterized protein n=1 Tax=Steinernema carpocapsae TaxID=34508 RepID=A0A4U8UVX5_STECR|nr:hypothetical protein L596_004419 [Steinernema carpocapsae]